MSEWRAQFKLRAYLDQRRREIAVEELLTDRLALLRQKTDPCGHLYQVERIRARNRSLVLQNAVFNRARLAIT